MERSLHWFVALVVMVPLVAIVAGSNPSHADWPQWRGPLGTGVAPDATPPIEWDLEKNVLWKSKIDGEGHAKQVV